MSLSRKDLIIAYRNEGLSYREIAEKTQTSESYCRNICFRANRVKTKKQHDSEPEMGLCIYCGKLLVNTDGAKPKKFCSDKCRYDYFNFEKKHKAYIRTCENCKKEFVAYGNRHKRFCSRDCQNAAIHKGGAFHG